MCMITKLDIECSTMSPGNNPVYFGIKKSEVKVMRHKNSAGVGVLHCC